jgi:opacity protein-like surface antigen
MKRLATLLLLGATTTLCFAQHDNSSHVKIQKFEFEGALTFNRPVGSYHKGDKEWGGDLSLEMRYNMPHSPLDFGGMLLMSSVWRDYPHFETDANGNSYDCPNSDANNLLYGALLTADYNFRQGRLINPYVGGGIGLGGYSLDSEGDNCAGDGNGVTPIFRLRGGVEFFRHVRLGVETTFAHKGVHSCGITIGLVIGGGKK